MTTYFELATIAGLKVYVLPALKDNYIYVIAEDNEDYKCTEDRKDTENREGPEDHKRPKGQNERRCAVVDPGEAKPVIDFLDKSGLSLSHILCTHHHWDHCNGVEELKERFGAEVWASKTDQSRIPGANIGLSEDTSRVNLFGREVRVLEVPGHTLGQICYWLPDPRFLFVGDTLFSCGCGRLFEGTAEQMFSSLRKIDSVTPAETQIFFGHEYTLRNIEFVEAYTTSGEPGRAMRDEAKYALASQDLRDYKAKCQALRAKGLPTSPGNFRIERLVNPFLRSASVDEFRLLRAARDLW